MEVQKQQRQDDMIVVVVMVGIHQPIPLHIICRHPPLLSTNWKKKKKKKKKRNVLAASIKQVAATTKTKKTRRFPYGHSNRARTTARPTAIVIVERSLIDLMTSGDSDDV